MKEKQSEVGPPSDKRTVVNQVKALDLGQSQTFICESEHDLTLMNTDRFAQYTLYDLQHICEEEWSPPLEEYW